MVSYGKLLFNYNPFPLSWWRLQSLTAILVSTNEQRLSILGWCHWKLHWCVSPHLVVNHLHKWAKSLFKSLNWQKWRSADYIFIPFVTRVRTNRNEPRWLVNVSPPLSRGSSEAELRSVTLQAFVLPREICAAVESRIRNRKIKSNFSFMVQICNIWHRSTANSLSIITNDSFTEKQALEDNNEKLPFRRWTLTKILCEHLQKGWKKSRLWPYFRFYQNVQNKISECKLPSDWCREANNHK